MLLTFPDYDVNSHEDEIVIHGQPLNREIL